MPIHLFLPLFTPPPTVPDDTEYSQGSKGQHNNALIECFGRPFTQLLGRAGANGALRPGRRYTSHQDKK
jgi:hypothetical protein